jgi:hypothetical protein
MTDERKKILEMLAEGKISAGDAERLLDKLETAATAQTTGAAANRAPEAPAANGKKPRYFRIVVEKPNEENVNIRIPLAFARSGSRLLAVLPPRIAERLAHHGIDLSALSSLSSDQLDETLSELNMDIDKGNGKKVRIFCE